MQATSSHESSSPRCLETAIAPYILTYYLSSNLNPSGLGISPLAPCARLLYLHTSRIRNSDLKESRKKICCFTKLHFLILMNVTCRCEWNRDSGRVRMPVRVLQSPMVRARLSAADILHRGVVLSLVGVCIWGIGTGILVHRDTLRMGRGSLLPCRFSLSRNF